MIRFKEDEVTELKKTTGELKQAIISIVSILNKHQSGKLYFGIKDNGEVIGQDISLKTLRDISQTIADNIEPRIYPTITNIKIEDKTCILVEFDGEDVPYLAYGRAYMRTSDEDKQLSMKELKRLIVKNEIDNEKWEDKPSDITLDDIDEDTLKYFIEKGKNKGRISFDYTTKEDILKKLNLIDKKGNMKNACKVLFGKDPRIELRAAIFATET